MSRDLQGATPQRIAAFLQGYVDAFAADDEGLTLSPENWNNLRDYLARAAAALTQSASAPVSGYAFFAGATELRNKFLNDEITGAQLVVELEKLHLHCIPSATRDTILEEVLTVLGQHAAAEPWLLSVRALKASPSASALTEEDREGLDCARTVLRVLDRAMVAGNMDELTYDRESTIYLIGEAGATIEKLLHATDR